MMTQLRNVSIEIKGTFDWKQKLQTDYSLSHTAAVGWCGGSVTQITTGRLQQFTSRAPHTH